VHEGLSIIYAVVSPPFLLYAIIIVVAIIITITSSHQMGLGMKHKAPCKMLKNFMTGCQTTWRQPSNLVPKSQPIRLWDKRRI